MPDSSWLLQYEAGIRLTLFLLLWVVLAALETRLPFRVVTERTRRWSRHLLMTALGTLAVRFALPMLAMTAAVVAQERGQGLFHSLSMPYWLALPLGVLLLDLAIYWQHRLLHYWPPLWRLHRMHHSDTEFDLSTAVRFHPVEIWLSMAIKVAVVLLLGIPVLAVLLFEILLNASALYTHSNLSLPPELDRRLRKLLVTPDMHRIHHSVRPHETNSNYGFALSLWDRWFGSYRAEAETNPQTMPIGIERFRSAAEQTWWQLLAQPWR